ncbi:inorganic phosphate transporter [Telmatospirillum sp. J64-1]|uniref:inorganic phosphate transporter n=1 Tax=Telmatospirillum sp. J64-1 TaxID=2502183 RepID=UPI00115C7456|nr:inorganic phosphate transporter [Telmatospirillum sp. J64-1]
MNRPNPSQIRKKAVDKDLKKIVLLETTTQALARRHAGLALSFLFLLGVWAFTAAYTRGVEHGFFIIIAGVVGGYMALNIGANDVANNVGPAVGSKALTMVGALIIAAICEAAGAILAGGQVVNTISRGIVDPAQIADSTTFILAMTSALFAGALWINLATYLGAPVSTTHSIVGGVVGAGIAAAGLSAVNWPVMGGIVASWVVSPALGGLVAALFYLLINVAILRQPDKVAAARVWVPILVAVMAGAFAVYMASKGLSRIWKPPMWQVLVIGAAIAAAVWAAARPAVAWRSQALENRRKSINQLFTIPLIASAALLSFAHGANDVANAVGPLAAVVAAVGTGDVAGGQVAVPGWVLLVGAIGISAGLALFGPRVIRSVGEEITRLDPMRAFCVALAAAITVIIASALGLPVSSTHIAVGGIFGVGFYREFHTNRKRAQPDETLADLIDTAGQPEDKLERKLQKAQKRRLVRRSHLMTIVAAWLVTVPLAAGLSALLFFLMRAVLV